MLKSTKSRVIFIVIIGFLSFNLMLFLSGITITDILLIWLGILLGIFSIFGAMKWISKGT